MDSLQFAYWLQGYFELTDSGKPLSAQQAQIIKDHLQLVFKKETPKYNNYKLDYSVDYTGVNQVTLPYIPITYPYIQSSC